MKRSIAFFLALLLLFLCACGSVGGAEQSPPPAAEPETAAQGGIPNQDAAINAYGKMLTYFGVELGDLSVMPACYGGAYIDNDNGAVLTIWLTEPTEENRALFIEACGTEEIVFREADYSFAELSAAMQAVDDYNRSAEKPLSFFCGIDEMANRVKLSVAPDREAEVLLLQSEHPCLAYELDEAELTPAPHDGEEELEGLTFKTEYPDYEESGGPVTYILENNSGETVHYGWDNFSMEVLRDGVWYNIPYRDGVAWTMVGLTLAPGDFIGGGLSFDLFNHSFAPGSYRICFRFKADARDYVAFAEFEVVTQAQRRHFVPLAEQSTDPETAAAQGCVVLGGDEENNNALTAEFVYKALCLLPCELRVVDPETGTLHHLSWRRSWCEAETLTGDGTLSTGLYPYLNVLENRLVLSTYADLSLALEEGYPVRERADLLDLAPVDEETAVRLTKAVEHHQQELQALLLTAGDGESKVSLSVAEYTPGQPEFLLYCFVPGRGSCLVGEYPADGEHPVYLEELGETQVGVHFVGPDGTEWTQILDVETGELTP